MGPYCEHEVKRFFIILTFTNAGSLWLRKTWLL